MTEKQDENFALPSSQADRKKIKQVIEQISAQYQMIDDRKEAIKDMVDALHDDFKMPKKLAVKLAQTMHKQNYADVSQESSLFELFYEGIIETNTQGE